MSHSKNQVFLSFRGKDTRYGFTSHLYAALTQTGIRTFKDENLMRGQSIDMELINAIRNSEASIIVISKRYASSASCLDELAEILNRRRDFGHKVLPVFYHVNPEHVSEQTGTFGAAFDGLVKELRNATPDKVKRWKHALKEVAGISGQVLHQHESEATFVKIIVEDIKELLSPARELVPPFVVGLDFHLESINSWLRSASNDVGVCMIYGVGGVGKTTLAKLVFNQNFDDFGATAFVRNREHILPKPYYLIKFYRKILSGILKMKIEDRIKSVDEGRERIQDATRRKRVLIVLDGVDELNQFEATISVKNWLPQGSKIIVTTKNEQVVMAETRSAKFEVKTLDESNSLKLFSWHAFAQTHPSENMIELSTRAAKNCCGLPLALEVLACTLSGKNAEVWETGLRKLESTDSNSKIEHALRICFESIKNDGVGELFLAIANNPFVREYSAIKLRYVAKRKNWGEASSSRDIVKSDEIQYLRNRGFLTIEKNGKLRVHQLLRYMPTHMNPENQDTHVNREINQDRGRRILLALSNVFSFSRSH